MSGPVSPATRYPPTQPTRSEAENSHSLIQAAAPAGTATKCMDPYCEDCNAERRLGNIIESTLGNVPELEWNDSFDESTARPRAAAAPALAHRDVKPLGLASGCAWPDDVGSWSDDDFAYGPPYQADAYEMHPALLREERKGDKGGKKVGDIKAIALSELRKPSSTEQFQTCMREIEDLIRNRDTATAKAVNECALRFTSLIKNTNFLFNSLSDVFKTAKLLHEDPFKTNDHAIKLSTSFFWNTILGSTKKLRWIRESYFSLLEKHRKSVLDQNIESCFKMIISSIKGTRHDKPDDLQHFVDLKKELQHPFFASFRITKPILSYLNKQYAKSKTYHHTLGKIMTQFEPAKP